MENVTQALLTHTFTIEGAHRRVALLQRVLELVVFSTEDTKESREARYIHLVHEEVGAEDQKALLAVGAMLLPMVIVENVAESIAALRSAVDALPRLVLYVPVTVGEDAVESLGTWCRDTLGAMYLIDLEIDPLMLGGCAFVRDGHFVDYSFSSRLHAQPGLVMSILASYES